MGRDLWSGGLGAELVGLAGLVHYGFQEAFGAGPALNLEIHFGGEAVGDLGGHAGADGGIERVAAVEEGFDEADFVEGDEGDVDRGKSFVWRGVLVGADAFESVFVDDDGAGDEIAEALPFPAEKDADEADAVHGGEIVHEAEGVANDGFVGADGAAVVFDDADFGDALAGGLAIPENFEESEVAGI